MTVYQIGHMLDAALSAGRELKKYFGKDLPVHVKSSPIDTRTKADLESERILVEALGRDYPTYNILSEEVESKDQGSEYTFVLDPLDGTDNFILGIPYFSVGIGLMHHDEILSAAVYNPMLDKMYWAERGQGAYINGVRISANANNPLPQATVALALMGLSEQIIGRFCYGLKVKRILLSWSFLLDFCLLAEGKIESVVAANLPLYDFVPGKLIAREAGALITDLKGDLETSDKNDNFISASRQEVLRLIASAVNWT